MINEVATTAIESKEKLEPTRIGVELVKAGGLGDILHMAKLVGNLSRLPGLQIEVYSSSVTQPFIQLCKEEWGSASIIAVDDPTWLEPDILITHALANTKLTGKTHIHVEEFSHMEGGQVMDADYILSTGLGFKPQEGIKIQSGITDSPEVLNKFEQRQTIQQQTRENLQLLINKLGLAEKVDMINSRLALVYTSSLSTNFSYISELSKVASQLKEPVVVLCVGSSRQGYRLGSYNEEPIGKELRALVKDAPISVYDLSDDEALQFDRREQSGVTIINLGDKVPHDFFLDLMLTVDFPSVMTGDQSLSEAIQICYRTKDVPPFLYYCYYGEKAQDFIGVLEEFDHDIAAIAKDYILSEDVPDDDEATITSLRSLFTEETNTGLGKLFIDPDLQKKYAAAFASIPSIIERRKAHYIPRADRLVWESDTMAYLIDCLLHGKEKQISLLRPVAAVS